MVHENQRVFDLATFLDRRDVIGWYGVTTKASVPLGQSHINSWDRVARSRAAAGSFAARDTRALTCNVYLDLSLSSLHLFPRLRWSVSSLPHPSLLSLVRARIYLCKEHSKLLFPFAC